MSQSNNFSRGTGGGDDGGGFESGVGGSVPGAPDDGSTADPSTDTGTTGGGGSTAGGGRGPRFDDDPVDGGGDPAPNPDPARDTGSGGVVDRVTSTVGSAVDSVTSSVGTPDPDITDRLTTGGVLSETPGTSDGVVPGTVGGVDVSEQRLQQEATETRQARQQRFDSNPELTIAGSDLPDRVITGAAQTASAVANPAGLATSAETAVEVGTSAPGTIADEGVRDVAQTTAAVGVDAAGSTVDAAQQNPAEFAGGAIFGAAAGTAATRGLSLRRGGSGSPDTGGSGLGDLSSAVDVETPGSGGRSFFGDTRGQASLGRLDRGDSDTIDGETVEATVERGDDVETIDAETFVDDRVRGGDDLESELRAAADEAGTLADRQLTPRQRAEDRVPPADEFASPAAQQREINRLADRFRQDAMGDLDNRVVPQGPSATTRGQFGLGFEPGAATVGGGLVETATASPGAGQVSAEASVFQGTDPTSLGFTPSAGTLTETDTTAPGDTTDGGDTTTDDVDVFAPPDDTTTGGGTTTQPGSTLTEVSTTIGTTTAADAIGAGATGAQASALGDAATATLTETAVQQPAVTGLDSPGPSRGRPRPDLEEDDRNDEPARVLFGTDSSQFDSGLLSGEAAAEDVFGR